MDLYLKLIRPLLFQFSPETAHEVMSELASHYPELTKKILPELNQHYQIPFLDKEIRFPIGLAAGLDKNADLLFLWQHLGFSHVEIGTITRMPQLGNPKPRIFRYLKAEALRNSMGFPGAGVAVVKERLKKFKSEKKNNFLIGSNIGKNKSSEGDEVLRDYSELYQELAPVSDYITINVSSPNTPGLRKLQGAKELGLILDSLKSSRKVAPCPLFVKIAPDLELKDVEDVVEVANQFNLAGIVATNTTIIPELGIGGVSGRPLKLKAKKIRNHLLKVSKGSSLEIVGVGGVDSAEDIFNFWAHGGKVMQAYTGFIYQGPNLLSNIAKQIDELLQKKGANKLTELFLAPESLKEFRD